MQDFWFVISGFSTAGKCVCLLQMFSLNLIAFYFCFHDSVAMLFNMVYVDSLGDSMQFTGFNLIDIEEQGVVYESQEDICDVSVISVTLQISDVEQSD